MVLGVPRYAHESLATSLLANAQVSHARTRAAPNEGAGPPAYAGGSVSVIVAALPGSEFRRTLGSMLLPYVTDLGAATQIQPSRSASSRSSGIIARCLIKS